jgi:hypothetical protein
MEIPTTKDWKKSRHTLTIEATKIRGVFKLVAQHRIETWCSLRPTVNMVLGAPNNGPRANKG